MFKPKILIVILILFGVLLAACSSDAPEEVSAETAAPVIQKGGCVACHIIPGVPGAIGTIGPDLSRMGEQAEAYINTDEYRGEAETAEAFIRESILKPDAFIPAECPNGHCQPGLMPATLPDLFSDGELETVVQYLLSLPNDDIVVSDDAETAPVGEAPHLTDDEWEKGTQIFFDRCAGCHGVLRNGATGPALTPENMLPKGTVGLSAIIFNGTPRGMPDWGKQGTLTEEETELMAKFIQNEPPQPPEMSMEQMLESWNVLIPVDQRPTVPFGSMFSGVRAGPVAPLRSTP